MMGRWTLWLNLLLVGLAGFFGLQIYEVWSRTDSFVTALSSKGILEMVNPRAVSETPKGPVTRSQGEYQVVAEKNPFHPSRIDWGETGRHVERPKVFLYGVTLAGDYQAALLAVGPVVKGRGARLYRLGEQVGGYTIKKIGPDRVLLALGEEEFPILLHDPVKPRGTTALSAPPSVQAEVRLAERRSPVVPEDRIKSREERRRWRQQRQQQSD